MIEDYGTLHRFGPTLFKTEITDECLERLQFSINVATEKFNQSLAGNIVDERALSIDAETENEILERCGLYMTKMDQQPYHNYPHYAHTSKITGIWVNFQKAFEWNPPHFHSGDLSFVIYIDNPIDYELEAKHPTQEGTSPTAGVIRFRYGEDHALSDKAIDFVPSAKEMLIFPSWLEHQVFPFTQEGITRISIAGNVDVTKRINID